MGRHFFWVIAAALLATSPAGALTISVSSVAALMDQNWVGAALVPSLQTAGASLAYDYDDSAEVISETRSATPVGLPGTTQVTFSIELTFHAQ